MSPAVATAAELERLALLLHTDPAELSYLDRFDAGALRALRTALVPHVLGGHRTAYRRIAAASRLLPVKATAALAQKRMPPRPAAAVVAALPTDHAADLAAAMSPAYLYAVSRHLAPDVAAGVTRRLPITVLVSVVAELVAHRDVVTMAEMVGALDDEQVRACVEAVDDTDLLVEMTLCISDPATRRRVAAALP